MTNPFDQEFLQKFVDMTKGFKGQTDNLMKEITTQFQKNMDQVVKNYTELQSSYGNGYTGITGQAQKANGQLLDSFDTNFAELKKQTKTMYTDLQTQANNAIDKTSKDFEAQCAEIVKKYPNLPDKVYKDVLKAITDGKGKVNAELEKRYNEVLDKVQKNYEASKKELKMPEMKTPKLPSLDLGSNTVNQATQALTAAMNNLQPALKTLTDNLPGPSANNKKGSK